MNQAEKEAYLREYALLKSKGKPFFPYAVAKDAIMMLIVTRREVMGRFVASRRLKIAGWAATGLMATAGLAPARRSTPAASESSFERTSPNAPLAPPSRLSTAGSNATRSEKLPSRSARAERSTSMGRSKS